MSVESVVPRGSVFGPCLLLFYINNMLEGLNATVRVYADNTIVYLTVHIRRRRLYTSGRCRQTWKVGESIEDGVSPRKM